jgi:hypothetical protein
VTEAKRTTRAEGGPLFLKTTINGLSNSSTEIGDQARKPANKAACLLVKAWTEKRDVIRKFWVQP